jgi:hypothetical protein
VLRARGPPNGLHVPLPFAAKHETRCGSGRREESRNLLQQGFRQEYSAQRIWRLSDKSRGLGPCDEKLAEAAPDVVPTVVGSEFENLTSCLAGCAAG